MENFRNVKSYRAKFTLPTSKGALTGDLSYVQPDRFQAAMIVPGASETDIIIVAHSVYLRLGSSAWNDISSNVAARNSAIAMLAAARGDTAFSADQSDKLQILSVDTNATQGCDLFSIQSKDAKPDAKPIALCIKDGYPKYFETATASGTVHVDYYDYAALFVIARPM